MTAVKVGDRIRVTIEGPVTSVGAGVVQVNTSDATFALNATSVQSVDVVSSPPKVGDVIPGDRVNDADLPVGTVIQSVAGDVYLAGLGGKWLTTGGTPIRPEAFAGFGPYTIQWVPA